MSKSVAELKDKVRLSHVFHQYVKPSLCSRPLSVQDFRANLSIGEMKIVSLSRTDDSLDSADVAQLDSLAVVNDGFDYSAVLESLPYPWNEESASKLLHNIEQYEKLAGTRYLLVLLPTLENWPKDAPVSAYEVYFLFAERGYRILELGDLERDTGTSYYESFGHALLVLPLFPEDRALDRIPAFSADDWRLMNRRLYKSIARSESDFYQSTDDMSQYRNALWDYLRGDVASAASDNVASGEELASVTEVEFSDIVDVVIRYASGAHPTEESAYRDFLIETFLESEGTVPLTSLAER